MEQPASNPETDHMLLKAEQDAIMREQASGAWKDWDAEADRIPDDIKTRFSKEPNAAEAHSLWVADRIRRGIEITSILRRTNTGPAKPGGRKGTSKKKLDLEALDADLLG